MTYKLIKEYPGSPKLNTLVKNGIIGVFKYNSLVFDGSKRLKDNALPHLYPDFWQKVVEKDYEILKVSAKSNHPNISEGEITQSWININMDYFNIHSIKRLSDGEIFIIGDHVNISTDQNPCCEQTIIQNLEFWLKEINKLSHIKKPLFTTEDGVDIFGGDKYYYPTYLFTISSEILPIEHQNLKESYGNLLKYSQTNNPKFSTKEKAEEYILLNKPCLSINDVMNVIYNPCESYTSSSRKLKEIVKLKIKKNE